MPRKATAWMLCLVATLALAAAPVARADDIPDPNEVVLAGAGNALPPAAKSVLDLATSLGQVSYQAREPFYTLVKVNQGGLFPLDINALISQLQGLVGVRFAERNVGFRIAADAPNDPLLAQEAQLAPLGVQLAWGTTNGSGVTIGIVDSGVQLDHPDLAPNIRNQGANLRARNGSNGADDQGHGTEVAGAAAARGGNGVGGAGIAWGSSIVPVKVTDATGVGTATDI